MEKKRVVLLSYLIIVLGALAGSIMMIFKSSKKVDVNYVLTVTEEYQNETKDTKYNVNKGVSYQINTLSKEKVFMEIVDYGEGIKINFDKDMAIVNSDKTINYDNKRKDYSIYIDSYLMVSIKDNDDDVIYKISYLKEEKV
ncbi:MAG: hypothetical protein J6X02_05805 [Bacilli bacterium]|nr:hypothetical protein [Bacilli bacterium]